MNVRLIAALLCALTLGGAAWAQNDDADEIVVTGMRYSERYGELAVPHVTLVRRADFATMELALGSDSRDPATRRAELIEALRGVARLAGSGEVTLALIYSDQSDDGETRIRPLTLEAALALVPQRPFGDSTEIEIQARTPIAAGDTLEDVEGRLARFVRAAPKPGRIVIEQGDLNLVLVNPPQYRAQLVAQIAADANRIVAALGSDYGVRLEGLESPIAWKRAGDLELKLFVPYRMIVLPRGTS
ncbi:MAG TPA: hypothetical protein VG841_14280 [Caulobacterales bacterium]|nr:hypothetical protein [Caulobacterales bacterium]